MGDLLYDSTKFLKEWLSCSCLGNFFEIKNRERKRGSWKLEEEGEKKRRGKKEGKIFMAPKLYKKQ